MGLTLEQIRKKVLSGENLLKEEALELAEWPLEKLDELLEISKEVREHFWKKEVSLCSIINARSGLCKENCIFCAQSSHYNTGVERYPLISPEKALEKAFQMEAAGVRHFSLVTSGRDVTGKDFNKILEIYRILQERTGLELHASLGILNEEKARQLKEVGITTYHHNLETGRNYFKNICTTHSFDDRIATIRVARSAGMEICSGGIIGMGETMTDRLEMVLELRELGVKSIPVNILNPIPGTPLENQERLQPEEILKTAAIFRLIHPRATFRLCSGRETALKDKQTVALSTSLNGMMVGGYLTLPGEEMEKDLEMLSEAGLKNS